MAATTPAPLADAGDGQQTGRSRLRTDEREELCHYIDEALTEHGVDVVGLTARHGLGRYQLTDQWRKW